MTKIETMLDLETMGTSADAAVVAIGAVKFDRDKPWRQCVVDRFYVNVDLHDAVKRGGRMDGATVMWWLQQDIKARHRLTQPKPEPVIVALNMFTQWMLHQEAAGVAPPTVLWGNGSDFDNAILASMYARAEMSRPWTHRDNRCYRTMKNELDPSGACRMPDDLGLVAHSAADDAEWQAMHLCKMYEELG